MLGLIQRVTEARVSVDQKSISQIGRGILLLLGIEREDTEKKAEHLLDKVLNYRIFEDSQSKMNLSLLNIQGELLIVSQFTLAADTQKGLRPSFTPAAPPEPAEKLYNYFINLSQSKYSHIATGQFGADMQIHLINDGPVTFLLKN